MVAFDLPYDPFGLQTLNFMKVQCAVCPTVFWVPDSHVGPFTCAAECARKRLLACETIEHSNVVSVLDGDNLHTKVDT